MSIVPNLKGHVYSCIFITKALQRDISVNPNRNKPDTFNSSAPSLHVWKNNRSHNAPISTAKMLARNLIRNGCSFDHLAMSSHFLSNGDWVARIIRSTSSAVYFFLNSLTFTFDIVPTLLSNIRLFWKVFQFCENYLQVFQSVSHSL